MRVFAAQPGQRPDGRAPDGGVWIRCEDLRHGRSPRVVTLGSEVTFREHDRTRTVQIVAPEDADIERRRISVLTPVGAALLGLGVGQKISWDMPDKRVAVLEVLAVRQPSDTPAH